MKTDHVSSVKKPRPSLFVRCDVMACGNPIRIPGGLVFTSPRAGDHLVKKYHYCTACAALVERLFKVRK